MGIRVRGLGPTRLNMFRTEEKTNKAMRRFLREAAEFVRDQAKLRAPIDTGDLESAIVASDGDLDYQRGRRVTVDVYVDENLLNLEEHQDFDYSVVMHEGVYNLGKRSQAKQDAITEEGVTVGPKYLENAFEDNKTKIREAAEEVLRRTIGNKG